MAFFSFILRLKIHKFLLFILGLKIVTTLPFVEHLLANALVKIFSVSSYKSVLESLIKLE